MGGASAGRNDLSPEESSSPRRRAGAAPGLRLPPCLSCPGPPTIPEPSSQSSRCEAPSFSSALLAAAPAAAQEVSIPYDRYRAAQRAALIVHEDHSVPMAAVDVWYHVGSRLRAAGPHRLRPPLRAPHVRGEPATCREGDFDNLLEAAGGGEQRLHQPGPHQLLRDRSPSNAVELALWLEADRMGGLLATMTQEKLDLQRDVVKNERRQSYENRPYGMFCETAAAALYPRRPPVLLDHHRLHGRPLGGHAGGRGGLLPPATTPPTTPWSPWRATWTPTRCAAMAQRYFGWIPRGAPVERPALPVPPIPADAPHHPGGPGHAPAGEPGLARHAGLLRPTTRRSAPSPRSSPREDQPALQAARLRRAGGAGRGRLQRLAAPLGRLLPAGHRARGADLDALETEVLEEVATASPPPRPPRRSCSRVVDGLETGLVSGLETAHRQGRPAQHATSTTPATPTTRTRCSPPTAPSRPPTSSASPATTCRGRSAS